MLVERMTQFQFARLIQHFMITIIVICILPMKSLKCNLKNGNNIASTPSSHLNDINLVLLLLFTSYCKVDFNKMISTESRSRFGQKVINERVGRWENITVHWRIIHYEILVKLLSEGFSLLNSWISREKAPFMTASGWISIFQSSVQCMRNVLWPFLSC